MAENDLDVIDVSGTDGVSLIAEVVLSDEPFWSKKDRFPIPEEYMEKLHELIGDGSATVTVGMEMKDSANYSSAGCSVYVKLTCGQDLDSINAARDAAHKMALKFSKQGWEHARFILDSALGKQPTPPKSMVKIEDGTVTVEEQDKTPKKVKASGQKSKIIKDKPRFNKG
jgi:hypothetical protein